MMNIDILKVAHHGSKTSTSEFFLSEVNPKLAIVSVGRNNRYGHPHEVTVERFNNYGALIHQTSDSGALLISFNKLVTFFSYPP